MRSGLLGALALSAVAVLVLVAGGLSPAAAASTSTSTGTAASSPPPASPGALPADVLEVSGGELRWGVRASFVSYIRGPIAHGTVSMAGGAVDEGDVFVFPGLPGGSFDDATGEAHASFAGSVRFTGHDSGQGPQLDTVLENFEVVRDATGSWLVADARAVPFEGTGGGGGAPAPAESFSDVKLVALATDGVLPVPAPPDGLTWFDLPASLTGDGAEVFGNYQAGDPMDSVTYTLAFAEVPDVEVTEPPADPVVTLDKTTVEPGETLTASAPGFLPGEQVEVWLHSTPTWVATAVADGSGVAVSTFVVPPGTPAGTHHLEMQGISSGAAVSSADFTVLEVAAPPPPPPTGTGIGTGTGSGSATLSGTATGTLPATGGEVGTALVGLVLVVVGAALVGLARRGRSRGLATDGVGMPISKH